MLASLVSILLAVSMATATPMQGCARCRSTGTVACKNHPGELAELEASVEFCSVAAGCEDCGGILRVDCPVCDEGTDTAAAAADRARVLEWMQFGRVERTLGRAVARLESERFELIVETGDRKYGRKRIDQHTLAHWLAGDLEQAEEFFIEHYDARPADYSAKMRLWIWNNPEEHSDVMAEVMGASGTGDFSMLGLNPVFSAWTEPGNFDTVEKIRSLFVHRAGHMLVSNVERVFWIGDSGGGWFDSAAGHWYEYAVFGETRNYCSEEAAGPQDYSNGTWRAALRQHLAREKEPVLPGLFTQNVGGLSALDQALSWSFYDFLVDQHRPAVRPILMGLKRKQPTREVLREHLGMTVMEAEQAWRDWVPERYPKRGDEPTRDED
jgi:hypothetical protein